MLACSRLTLSDAATAWLSDSRTGLTARTVGSSGRKARALQSVELEASPCKQKSDAESDRQHSCSSICSSICRVDRSSTEVMQVGFDDHVLTLDGVLAHRCGAIAMRPEKPTNPPIHGYEPPLSTPAHILTPLRVTSRGCFLGCPLDQFTRSGKRKEERRCTLSIIDPIRGHPPHMVECSSQPGACEGSHADAASDLSFRFDLNFWNWNMSKRRSWCKVRITRRHDALPCQM